MSITAVYYAVLGLGGIFGQDWYIYQSGQTWFFDAAAWGWSMLLAGIALGISAWLLMAGNMVGRVIGTIVALASIFANVAMLAVAPFWSIIAIVSGILILYAILAHGGEMKQLAE